MEFKQLVEKRNELEAKKKKLKAIMTEAKTDNSNVLDLDQIKSIEGTQTEKLEAIRKLKEGMDDLGKEVDALLILDAAQKSLVDDHDVKGGKDAPRFNGDDQQGPKGFGDLVAESDVYKKWYPGAKERFAGVIKNGARPLLKTDFTTSAGWAPESLRIGRVIDEALRPIQVIDTIPPGTTTQAAIVYMEETTVTTAAAERSEAAAYAESTLALTEQSVTVRSIGTSLPVTDEQLADVAEVRSYLNMRLGFLVRQRLDLQILVGDGSAPNISGINDFTGLLTQAIAGDNVPDAFYKAMRQVRVTGRAFPSVVYIHPTDWQGVRLLRTDDGLYIWGNPSEAGPMRLWGVMVVETDAQTQGTGLTGDATNFLQLFMRQDVTVEIGFVDDDFLDGRQTIRAGLRAALADYRPAAFCQITGI